MEEETNELINLGNNIQLSGFKIIDYGEMVIIKKIIGTQVKKIQDMLQGFERITIHLKPIHKTNNNNMLFNLTSEIIYEGKVMNAKSEDRNLFMAISNLFNKFENMINKKGG